MNETGTEISSARHFEDDRNDLEDIAGSVPTGRRDNVINQVNSQECFFQELDFDGDWFVDMACYGMDIPFADDRATDLLSNPQPSGTNVDDIDCRSLEPAVDLLDGTDQAHEYAAGHAIVLNPRQSLRSIVCPHPYLDYHMLIQKSRDLQPHSQMLSKPNTQT